MDTLNETASRECRFLSEGDFDALYETFSEAFSDYVFPFALTETQFRNHINLNAVDISRTAGFFDRGKLVGFSLNGFGKWEGRETVYDAGTGVIPSARRQGVSQAMFEMMLPRFKENGIEQCLLEVIATNSAAITLYEKLGFEPVRKLALLQCDGDVNTPDLSARDVIIDQITEPDWKLLSTFWDGKPSWQNSIEAVERSFGLKRMLGAFHAGQCIGYIVFSANFGRVAQFAVDKKYRCRGVGTALVSKMREMTAPGYSLQVLNIDTSLDNACRFFRNRGFYERLTQHEMLKLL